MNERRGVQSQPQTLGAVDTLSTPIDVAGFDFANIICEISGAAVGRELLFVAKYANDAVLYIIGTPLAVSPSPAAGIGYVFKVELGAAVELIVATGGSGWSAGNEVTFKAIGFSQGCE